MSTTSSLAWGILGTGSIANTFAVGIAHSRTGRLVAVGSRRAVDAEKFAARHGGIKAHGTYDALLADPDVQAVYISTPHPFHAEWCVKAARAGKHILCEKPFTLNHREAVIVADEVRARGVFLMEAFMYRCHPQTARLVELIRGGVIGEIGVIQATFSFKADFNVRHRLFANELGGGGILDVGCYTMSMARLVAGAASGRPFVDPTRVLGLATLHPETGTDLYALATAEFPGGLLAQLAAGGNLRQETGLRIFGSRGSIHVPAPFVLPHEGGSSTIHLRRDGEDKAESIVIECADYFYALEADAVSDAIAAGLKESPCMPVADSLGNMRALDQWRASAGLVYESEKI
jgi:predicted dehydrogenase